MTGRDGSVNGLEEEEKKHLAGLPQEGFANQSARPMWQWHESWPKSVHALLERSCQVQGETRGIRDFVRVLLLSREHSAADMEAAVERAITNRVSRSEGVRHPFSPTDGNRPTMIRLTTWSFLPPADVAV